VGVSEHVKQGDWQTKFELQSFPLSSLPSIQDVHLVRSVSQVRQGDVHVHSSPLITYPYTQELHLLLVSWQV